MGGPNCCIVGCAVEYSRCKGVSFHSLPKRGKSTEQDLWRQNLIHIIGRSDKSFNPMRAKICSRHFSQDCFEKHCDLKRLKFNSLPTLFLPAKSIITTVSKPRKAPTPRATPTAVMKVAYYSLDEIKKDLCKIEGWAILVNNKMEIILALIENDFTKLKLHIDHELKCYITIKGHRIPYPEDAVEKCKLSVVLSEISQLKLCPGVYNEELQQFVSSPDPNREVPYVKEYTNNLVNGNIVISSTIRSTSCKIIADVTLCAACTLTKNLLERKKNRTKMQTELNKYTPLSVLSKETVVNELKNCRKREADLKNELKAIKSKLAIETMQVNQDLHSSFEDVLNKKSN